MEWNYPISAEQNKKINALAGLAGGQCEEAVEYGLLCTLQARESPRWVPMAGEAWVVHEL